MKVIILDNNGSGGGGGLSAFVLVVIAVVGLGLYTGKLDPYGFLANWENHPWPYKYASAFYFYVAKAISFYINTYVQVWGFVSDLNVTTYPNINLIIKIIAVLLYLAAQSILIMLLLGLTEAISGDTDSEALLIFGTAGILALPLALCFIWAIGAGIIGWLFAK